MSQVRFLWIHLLSAVAALVILTPKVNASGTSTQRPPRVPTAEEARSAEQQKQFDLGQRLFNQKIKVMDNAVDATTEATQRQRLDVLQARLPSGVAKKKNLPSMAGRLTEEQLAALEAFVTQRYGVKK